MQQHETNGEYHIGFDVIEAIAGGPEPLVPVVAVRHNARCISSLRDFYEAQGVVSQLVGVFDPWVLGPETQ